MKQYVHTLESSAASELEMLVNRLLGWKKVNVHDVVFGPCSPGDTESKKFAMLFLSDAEAPCPARLKIFDSGVDNPQLLGERISEWLHESGAQIISTRSYTTQAVGIHSKVRVYITVLYRAA